MFIYAHPSIFQTGSEGDVDMAVQGLVPDHRHCLCEDKEFEEKDSSNPPTVLC
jgi:hypothetical protein